MAQLKSEEGASEPVPESIPLNIHLSEMNDENKIYDDMVKNFTIERRRLLEGK